MVSKVDPNIKNNNLNNRTSYGILQKEDIKCCKDTQPSCLFSNEEDMEHVHSKDKNRNLEA